MSTDRPAQPGQYEIRVQGHLHSRWATWFDGMDVATDSDGTTVLSGSVVDQAALHGLLQRVQDMGLALVSVRQVDPLPPERPAPTSTNPSTNTRRPA